MIDVTLTFFMIEAPIISLLVVELALLSAVAK
jgi:hypothetical protein